MIPYELYTAKRGKNDQLLDIIHKNRRQRYFDQPESKKSQQLQSIIKKKADQKRVRKILQDYSHKVKITAAEPFVKRTWVSPLEGEKNGKSMWRKVPCIGNCQTKHESAATKILKIQEINKNVHLFGEFMFSEFDINRQINKQNAHHVMVFKGKDKAMENLHKQYLKLQSNMKRSIVICNKNSELSKKMFVNPLSEDPYFKKIIKKQEEGLVRLLISSLCHSNNFTFSSYVSFYEIFVWQQASKDSQIQFVTRLLMNNQQQISYFNLSAGIDYFCEKSKLIQNSDALNGFHSVMKKLIFGDRYPLAQCNKTTMTRSELKSSLENNEECISILINVFYRQ